MKLNQDLREFIELLNSKGVKFIVVGGHAVAYHGYPRFTGDIDFFVERSQPNAEALEQVINAFGFSGRGLKAKDFLQPEVVVQLGRPPHRIDILTSITGVDFTQAWQTKVAALLDGLPVSFISKEFLIVNKRAVKRAQDIADLKLLIPESDLNNQF